MKSFLFLLLLTATSVQAQVSIYQGQDYQTVNHAGSDGVPGLRGKDAYQIDCLEHPGVTLDGLDGEDGEAGGDGENGIDTIVVYKNVSDLSQLKLNVQGGEGAIGGIGGRPSQGCYGGKTGQIGEPGEHGIDGRFGRVYLAHETEKLPETKNTEILSLLDLTKQGTELSYKVWKKHQGLRSLLHSDSNTADEYFTFSHRVEKKIKVRWESFVSASEFSGTRLAINLNENGLTLNVYRGALIAYRVENSADTVVIIIDRVYREETYANLHLGRLRGSGTNLMLEVDETFRMSHTLKTNFALTLIHVSENTSEERSIGHFRIKPQHVIFDDGKFQIYIGRLNYPARYKRKGTRLKIYLSVYRESSNQRRSYVLDGLFSI